MTVEITPGTHDRLVVVYDPDPDQGEDLYLLAALQEWLWSTFRVALDCEYVELHLVYVDHRSEDAPEAAPASGGDLTGP